EEIAGRLDGAFLRGTRAVADKNGMVLFDYAGDVRDLLALRTIEDLFVVVAALPNPPPTIAALRLLKDTAAAMPVEPVLRIARQIKPGRGGRGQLRFRVVARPGGRAAYRRGGAPRGGGRAGGRRAGPPGGFEDGGRAGG